MTPIDTSSTISVAIAFTLGFRPRRAREKMTNGIVVAPGPDRKQVKPRMREREKLALHLGIAKK